VSYVHEYGCMSEGELDHRELARLTGKSVGQVRRDSARLLALGLIADRRNIRLVSDWQERWDRLAVLKGTDGKKQADIEALETARLEHRRSWLVYRGQAFWVEDRRVAAHETGEIV
jgi:hypothetical protein